uniref:Putative metabolite transport protein CsbC n=1 Tax=Staphylococcus epidermidis TaxID=1282 RepID=A0A1Z1V0W1_STAEP|nr:putative metabolite transport protein CsbC [Staphylococcus epidermidis]
MQQNPILWRNMGANYVGNVARNVPSRARGAATGIAIVVLQIGTLIISQVFPILVNMLEVQYVFLIFAVIGALALIFVVKFLPETRGKSLEEIELQLQN